MSDFLAVWPTASTDSVSKISARWSKLNAIERKAAIDGIAPFLAELKRNHRDHIISGWKYLAERKWELITASTSTTHDFHTWSRDWWAVLLDKLDRGERATAWFTYADQAGLPVKRFCAVKADAMPGIAQLAMLDTYPSDGAEIAAWRPWFEQRGLHLPIWANRFWLFLPSPNPPNGCQSIWSRSTP